MTRALACVAIMCVALACSVGEGSGEAFGHVRLPECRLLLDNPSYSLRPDFFVADFVDDPRTLSGLHRRILQIRMQHGSYGEQSSDGISILVRNVDDIAMMPPGTAIPVGIDAQVELSLYLGQSCPAGLPRGDFFTLPSILSATTGTIFFDAIYAPDLYPDRLRIAAHFDRVRFEDSAMPTMRFAQLDGDFTFFYQRGRPAQHFP